MFLINVRISIIYLFSTYMFRINMEAPLGPVIVRFPYVKL
jgi:hypothetical protein